MRAIVVGALVAAVVALAAVGRTEREPSSDAAEAVLRAVDTEPASPLQGGSCGDGRCQPPEDCNSCPQDCGDCCGNRRCEPPEDCRSCPEDCGPCS